MKRLNVNSLLITVAGAVVSVLLTFTLRKLDAINTGVIQVSTAQSALATRIERLEKDMVMRSEFRSEISRIEAEIRPWRP